MYVDYGAHLGGALLGLVVGGLLVLTWRGDAPLPRFRRPALVLSLVAALCLLAGGLGAADNYRAILTARAERIPPAELPRTVAEMLSRSSRLVAAYPRDPVAYFYDGLTLLRQGDASGVERQVRTGLSLALAEPERTMPTMTNDLRATLALVLLEEARRPEAEEVAREACVARGEAAPAPQIIAQLGEAHLCGGDGAR